MHSLRLPPLPHVHVWRVTYRCRSGGVLPTLPTTALHGALGHVLYNNACVAKARPSCAGCPARPCCAYARVFSPAPLAEAAVRELGVTTEVPRPLSMAPEGRFLPTPGAPVRVQKGESVSFRMSLLASGSDFWTPLVRSLREVGKRGIGMPGSAARLDFVDIDSLDNPNLPVGPVEAVTLRFVTPVRLKHEGKFASRLSPELLIEALVRRAQLVASLQGQPWEPAFDVARLASVLTAEEEMRQVTVRRYSSTQQGRLTWPGMLGTIRVRGPSLTVLWPLLLFGARAQIGKGTTFGFGRYELQIT